MKKTFLLGLMALTFIAVSCSDDDNTGGTDPVVTTTLKKITETHYSIVSVWPEETTTDTIAGQKTITEFENGRPSLMSLYQSNGYYNSYYQYTYNTAGFLTGQLYHYNGNGSEINTTFSYDAQGRLSQIEAANSNGTTYYTSFAYSGNTVTETMTISGNSYQSETVYTLNSNNTISQEAHNDGLVVDYTYNGFSMMTANATLSNGDTNNRTFTYDETHDTSLLGLQSLGGDFWFNTVYLNDIIYHTHETATFPLEKYMTQQNRGGYDITNLIYEFNGIGQPTSRKIDFVGGSGYLIQEFEYE